MCFYCSSLPSRSIRPLQASESIGTSKSLLPVAADRNHPIHRRPTVIGINSSSHLLTLQNTHLIDSWKWNGQCNVTFNKDE